jgi:hypothetical protein
MKIARRLSTFAALGAIEGTLDSNQPSLALDFTDLYNPNIRQVKRGSALKVRKTRNYKEPKTRFFKCCCPS